MKGLVVRTQSGFYTIWTEAGNLTCQLRGKLKQVRQRGDVIAVGDWVEFSRVSDTIGMIEKILPRERLISRMSPEPKGTYEQILIANPDQIVLVFSFANPAPKVGMLDRFLVISEKSGVPPLIVVNKLDLKNMDVFQETFQPYLDLSYPVLFTCTKDGYGVEKLHGALIGKISLFTGPSGVGKSSLLNAIQPGLGLAVKEISRSTSKGKHTTVVRELFALEAGGWVADTPGLKALALWDIEPEELDGYFPEFRSRVAACQFNNCSHQHEPGCAILQAVQDGSIHPQRYESYLRMRFGE